MKQKPKQIKHSEKNDFEYSTPKSQYSSAPFSRSPDLSPIPNAYLRDRQTEFNNYSNIGVDSEQKTHENDMLYDNVVELLRNIPGFDNVSDFDKSKIEDLIKTLNSIRNSDDVHAENLAKDVINDFIESLSKDKGTLILPKDRKLLERSLLQQTLQQTKKTKENSFDLSSSKGLELSGISLDLSSIRNISLHDEQTKLNEYLNTLNNVLDSWIKSLELKIDIPTQKNVVNNLASEIFERQKYLELSSKKKSDTYEMELLKYQIFRRLNKFNLKNLPEILTRVSDLYKHIAAIDNNSYNGSNLTRRTSNLVNNLKTWLENITHDAARTNIKPYSDEIFQDLANKLTDLDYSNNYFSLKNEILEWLPKIFTNLDKSTMNNFADSLISHLIINIAKQSGTNTGSMYRSMLRSTTSGTLPSFNLSASDDINILDLYKERLVDAFINLHYFADDMEALEKFKSKLHDEVNKFCNEYLKKYPEAPLSPEDLSKKLYIALRNVTIPDIEMIRPELEQVRLKAEIIDWLQTVPIDKSKITDPQLTDLVSGLAKRLHQIEHDKHLGQNKQKEMKNEIIKLLQVCGINDGDKIDQHADVLMDKLKSTDKSRKMNISNIGKHGVNITSQVPPCGLTCEDRAHLERIRKRSNVFKDEINRDVCARCPLRKSEIHTEINNRLESTGQTIPSIRATCDKGVSPQVIIEDHHWDSSRSSMSQTKGPLCTCDKGSETEPQMIRTPERFEDTYLNKTFPQRTRDKIICINSKYNLEGIIQSSRPQKRGLPEHRCSMCKRMFPCEVVESGRRFYCDDCAQRRYSKCRRRHCNFRQQNYRPRTESCLKYCSNCSSACPYPTHLFFGKDI
ncbi:uncharacterized protein LOC128198936 [Bicyclus anynana]|uniref:Uncharacterized protein LOC128198936 n=1 Tax=Bicyclus anynana TaxID=110368 RepID=A0ABM3LUG4_BICAN|nr:uncharacterized protein LOC128198936 [Bicyclus anynana]